MLIQVGELAKRAGLTVRTLHHYEQTGLLTPSARSEAGYRLYNLSAVQRLHMIKALAQAGLTLATIKDYLDRQNAVAARAADAADRYAQRPAARCWQAARPTIGAARGAGERQ